MDLTDECCEERVKNLWPSRCFGLPEPSWPLALQAGASGNGSQNVGRDWESLYDRGIEFVWLILAQCHGVGQWSPTLGLQMFLDYNSQRPSAPLLLARICSPRTSGGPRLGTTGVGGCFRAMGEAQHGEARELVSDPNSFSPSHRPFIHTYSHTTIMYRNTQHYSQAETQSPCFTISAGKVIKKKSITPGVQ